jgi:hypothetical protein
MTVCEIERTVGGSEPGRGGSKAVRETGSLPSSINLPRCIAGNVT